MVHRILTPLKSNSFFLFGPRGTGKSTLLHSLFDASKALFIDLLDPLEEDLFNRRPDELEKRLAGLPRKKEWVVIDEIQKAPRLLDVVHRLIERDHQKFALTGSSSRKLKGGASNLLAGRAFVYSLHPFTHLELGDAFDLTAALEWGGLPKLLDFQTVPEKLAFLQAYTQTYLKEEIQMEQWVRKLTPFRNFIEVAAQCNGQILNFSKIADDIGVETKTVQSYFTILEDTLVGVLLPPYHRSFRKRQRANPKFYFFDLGVKRALERTLSLKLIGKTYAFGNAFEHFIVIEAHRLNDYFKKEWRFSYLRTHAGVEIDLIADRPGLPPALIEIKSTDQVTDRDVRALTALAEDFGKAEAFCLSLDPVEKKIGRVACLPWKKGLAEIGLTGG